MAPFVPFMAEAMWRNLAVKPLGSAVPESVHLCDYPQVDAGAVDEKLSAEMALIREIVSLGRNVRSLQKLKVRLPLPKVIIVLADPSKTEVVKRHEDVLLDALNVKKVDYAAGAEQFVNYALKPNFKAIGAKHRELVPAIKKALAEADAAKLRVELDKNGSCTIDAGGHAVKLETDEVEVTLSAKEGYAAASGRQEVVVLDTHVTPELQEEGFARELVFRVNGFRGELNLKYEQRIKLAVKGSAKLEDVARKFQSYICGETLATELRTGETPDGWKTIELEVEGEKGVLALEA
jgi:isoleucyl-tRNA synthetase